MAECVTCTLGHFFVINTSLLHLAREKMRGYVKGVCHDTPPYLVPLGRSFYARVEIEKPLFIGGFSLVCGIDEKREKRTSPFRHLGLVGGEGFGPPT